MIRVGIDHPGMMPLGTHYGTSRVKTFYGDGSTASYTFDSAPSATDVYTVYYNGV